MRKLIMFASLVAALGTTVPSWGCTQVDELPGWIDPMTPAADYPCVLPGMTNGNIPFYDENGMLGFLDVRGRFLNRYGLIVDNAKRYVFADDDVSVGEWVLLMQGFARNAGRALQRIDLIP